MRHPAPQSPVSVATSRFSSATWLDRRRSPQRLDAEEWREVLAKYQQAASDVVARFGGYVAKNLGDGLLIYFGGNHRARRRSRACDSRGLAIVDAMLVPLNATLATRDDETRLEVRIGIHTGPVVIADGGEVFGDTANIAARVQTAAEPDTVAITAATHRIGEPGCSVVEECGPQALKGVREPVTLYCVVLERDTRPARRHRGGTADELCRPRTRAGDGDRSLGNERRTARGRTSSSSGKPGLESRALSDSSANTLRASRIRWLECDATPYTESTPFYTVIELAEARSAPSRPKTCCATSWARSKAALTRANLVSRLKR